MDIGYGDFLRKLKGYGESLPTAQLRELYNEIGSVLIERSNPPGARWVREERHWNNNTKNQKWELMASLSEMTIGRKEYFYKCPSCGKEERTERKLTRLICTEWFGDKNSGFECGGEMEEMES